MLPLDAKVSPEQLVLLKDRLLLPLNILYHGVMMGRQEVACGHDSSLAEAMFWTDSCADNCWLRLWRVLVGKLVVRLPPLANSASGTVAKELQPGAVD